jgi:Tol biopolymer transport system component
MEPKRLTAADAAGAFLRPNHIVFIQQGTLVAREFDLARGELVGNTETLADSVGIGTNLFSQSGFSVSADGRIAYRSGGGGSTQLVWFDRTGKAVGVAGEPDGNKLTAPELSPDLRRVAVDRTVQGNRDIWLMDLLRGGLTRFTFDPAIDGYPLWSPDGKQITFYSGRKGIQQMYWKPANGVGSEEVLFESPNGKWPLDWSRDGRFLLYHEDGGVKTGPDIWALSMTGGERKPIAVSNTPFAERTGQISPDSRFVAYDTDESGQLQIVVQPFPNPTGKWQISSGGGFYPRWRADGKELYFVAPDGKMMAALIHASASSFEAETPRPSFQTQLNATVNKDQYTVSADGRFLISQSLQESSATPITLILNWHPSEQ